MKITFDSGTARRDFGLRRLESIKKSLDKIEEFETSMGRRTSAALITFVQNCSWNRHLGYKHFGAMVSIYVDGSISKDQGYSVRRFTNDVRGGRGFKKPQVMDAVVRDLKKVADRDFGGWDGILFQAVPKRK